MVLCPKCSGRSWYEITDLDLILRCLCGYHKVIYTELEDGSVIRHVQKEEEAPLPRQGTKMYTCLEAFSQVPIGTLTTKEVAEQTGYNTSDTATYLMILQHRGLVVKLISRRGIEGGSSWRLTRRAAKRLGY